MRFRLLLPLFVVVTAADSAAAADPLPLAELEKRVVKIVYDAEVIGVDLYNAGKHEECLRVYQGTLLALGALLDHRPEVAKTIKTAIEKAAEMSTVDAAFVLRRTLDETSAACGNKAPLYDRLGGGKREDAGLVLSLYVQDFVAAAGK